MTSDETLVALLDHVWASIDDVGGVLSEAEWKTPTEVPGWSVQDNLVHVTALEWRLLGRPDPTHTLPDGLDLAHVRNDFGRANELFVDSRRAGTGADALAVDVVRDVRVARDAERQPGVARAPHEGSERGDVVGLGKALPGEEAPRGQLGVRQQEPVRCHHVDAPVGEIGAQRDGKRRLPRRHASGDPDEHRHAPAPVDEGPHGGGRLAHRRM